jgi:GNAT superfamily N-acetyltransferase
MYIEIREAKLAEILPVRHQVLWPDKPFAFVRVEGDEQGIHFGLYKDDLLVTVISLFGEGKSIRFRKFATLTGFQNQGFGRKMILHTIDYARERGFDRIWCDARLDALRFYERAGFEKFSTTFFKEGVAYCKIEKVL